MPGIGTSASQSAVSIATAYHRCVRHIGCDDTTSVNTLRIGINNRQIMNHRFVSYTAEQAGVWIVARGIDTIDT